MLAMCWYDCNGKLDGKYAKLRGMKTILTLVLQLYDTNTVILGKRPDKFKRLITSCKSYV